MKKFIRKIDVKLQYVNKALKNINKPHLGDMESEGKFIVNIL